MKLEINTLNKKHLNILFKTLKEYKYNFIHNIEQKKDLNKWFLEFDDEESWLVAKFNSRIIGFISFEGCNEYKEIQIFLRVKYLSQGFGTIALSLAEKWARKRFIKLKAINANIAGDNIGSILLFRKMGYFQECSGDYFKYFY